MKIYALQCYKNGVKQFEHVGTDYDDVMSDAQYYLQNGYQIYLQKEEIKIPDIKIGE